MTISQNELAFFGGWRTQSVNGTSEWGDPLWRNREIITTGVTLTMPADAPEGVEYTVFNHPSSTGNITIGTSTVLPGNGESFMRLGTDWLECGVYAVAGRQFGTPASTAIQYGVTQPTTILNLPVLTSTANYDALAAAIFREGYDGSEPVYARVEVITGIAIGTIEQSLRSFTTGDTVDGISWAAGSKVILDVANGALIGGWGGAGGRGAHPTIFGQEADGEAGGQAIRAEIDLDIIATGVVFGGGGGGGGGGGDFSQNEPGGGGGGGAGINMAANGAILGSLGGIGTAPATWGTRGRVNQGGDGGSGGQGGNPAGSGGSGGDGGARASVGTAGFPAVSGAAGATFGAAGAAISKASGVTVNIISGAANIYGTTVTEAT